VPDDQDSIPPWMQGWTSREEQQKQDQELARREAEGIPAKIRRTRYHRTPPDTVTVERHTINDNGWLAKSWTEVISNGQARGKPGPDHLGNDRWPDWQEVVATAEKKIRDKVKPSMDVGIEGRRYYRR
jgi:hypothetical protein